MSAVTARFLFVCAALVGFASAALGDGIYQRTKDGKTMVWNNDPKPGDVAAWSGDRDREGYASGFGTLTWYREQQKSETGAAKSALHARYWAYMVRGKFNGPVNIHSKGKTDHAIFVDGRRTSRWAAGPAPSRRVAEQRVESLKQERAAEPASARQPPVQRSEVRGQRSEISDRPAEQIVRGKPDTEPLPPAAGPSVRAGLAEKSKVEVNDSLRLLVEPPSSLRAGPTGNSSSVEAKTEAASSPAGSARLTKEEVVDLADAEARSRGYNLAEYQRLEPQYNAADETWSLLYDEKPDANGMSETGKHFSVTIDDKTKGAVFVQGK